MGYTTDFTGRFTLDKPLAPEHAAYLNAFSGTRRMGRKADVAATMPDPVRVAAGLPIGEDGEYFVGGGGPFGQARDTSVVDQNRPAPSQPGLWCKWVPSEDGLAIEWNQAEKFYEYEAWLQYLVDHFLTPWGYSLTGTVEYQGEDFNDRGVLRVEDGKVRTVEAVPKAWTDISAEDREEALDALESAASDADVGCRAAIFSAIHTLRAS